MKQVTDTDNDIFKYTFTGAMLFIATVAFSLINYTGITTFNLPHIVPAVLMGISSLALLYKAIKSDRLRIADL